MQLQCQSRTDRLRLIKSYWTFFSPQGPSTQIVGFQGPKNNSGHGFWDLKPYCLGTRTLWVGDDVTNLVLEFGSFAPPNPWQPAPEPYKGFRVERLGFRGGVQGLGFSSLEFRGRLRAEGSGGNPNSQCGGD